MPDLLDYSPSHSVVYYTAAKRVYTFGLLVGLLVAAVLIVLGAWLYAVIQPNITSPVPRIMGAFTAALAVGLLGLIPVRYGKVQLPVLAAFIGSFLALLAIYVMWVTWVHGLMTRVGFPIPYSQLVGHPLAFFKFIKRINTTGVWAYKREIVKGVPLLILWFIEIGAVLACGTLIPLKGIATNDPTCSACGARCIAMKNAPRFDNTNQHAILAAIENRDFNLLAQYATLVNDDAPEVRLRLLSCPACKNTNVLTVSHIAWHINVDRRATVKIVPLINQLLIAPAEAEQLRRVCTLIYEKRAGKPSDEESLTAAVPHSS